MDIRCIIIFAITLLMFACNNKNEDGTRELTKSERENLPFQSDNANDHSTKAIVHPLAKTCFSEMCGNSKTFFEFKDRAIPRKEYSEIQGLVKKLYQEEDRNIIFFRDKLERTNLSEVALDETDLDFLFLFFSISQLPHFSPYFRVNSLDEYVVDRNLYKKENPTLASLYPDEIYATMEQILNISYVKIRSKNILIWDAFNLTKKSNKSFDYKLIDVLEMSISLEKKVQESLGIRSPVISEGLLNRVRNERDLNFSDSKIIYNHLISASAFELVLSGSLKGIAAKARFKNSQIYQQMEKLSVADTFNYRRLALRSGEKQCIDIIEDNLRKAPTVREIEMLKMQITKIKEKALLTTDVFIKEQEKRNALAERINATEFSMPQSLDENLKLFKFFLNEEIKTLVDIRNFEGNKVLFFSKMMAAANMLSKTMEIQSDRCNFLDDKKIFDHALTSLNKIEISAPVVLNQYLALSVMAHELGHIVYSVITGNDQSPMSHQDVIQLNNEALTCESLQLKRQSKYLNESFSDSFSAKIIKSFVKDEKAKAGNFGCALIGLNKENLSLVNTDEKDAHPSSFFRAINWQKNYQGRLSDNCNAMLQQEGFPESKSCLVH